MIQSTILGALLTFAPAPWYAAQTVAGAILAPHDPLLDQQLAGVIMWIPGGPLYLGAFLWLVARWLRAADAEASLRSQWIWREMSEPTLKGD
jgi:cytochrome c oxidase assembly factor CtaG